LAPDRPSVEVDVGFSHAAVVFEVRVANPTSRPMRNISLRPTAVPEGAELDRARHRITLLPPRTRRVAQFRLRPAPGQRIVALDVTVDWDSAEGDGRDRFTTSSEPVDLALPELRPASQGGDVWHSRLRGGPAVEVRVRVPGEVEEVTRAVERATSNGLPGETMSVIDEGPTGPVGSVNVRAAGTRGRRAGLLVELIPARRREGTRVLVVASATSDDLLTRFYLAGMEALGDVLPGIVQRAPVSLVEEP
jgi:hypothetical protein